MRQHGPPCGPVVPPFCPPDIQLVVNSLAVQNAPKATVGFGVLMVAATGENMDMAAAPNLFQ